jgi:hypothetical protein
MTSGNRDRGSLPAPVPAPPAGTADSDADPADLQVPAGAVVVPAVPGIPCPVTLPPVILSSAGQT